MLIRFRIGTMALALLTALTGCGPSGLIEVEVTEYTETDHWSGDDNKACKIRYKLLNNSGHTLNQFAVTQVWRDKTGHEETTVSVLGEPLPHDRASGSITSQPIFGSCSEITFVRFEEPRRCDAPPLTKAECTQRLRIKLTATLPS